MQPSAPTPQMPSNDPYAFILNSGNAPKKANTPSFNANDQTKRIILVLGGGFILLMIAAIFMAVLSNSGKGAVTALEDIAATQTEIVRVADVGITKGHTPATRNFAATTTATVQSEARTITKLIASHGVKLTPAQLGAKKSAKTDAALTAADQSNSFDSIFNSTFLSSLVTYRSEIKTAYDASSSATEKARLKSMFDDMTTIIDNQKLTNPAQ